MKTNSQTLERKVEDSGLSRQINEAKYGVLVDNVVKYMNESRFHEGKEHTRKHAKDLLNSLDLDKNTFIKREQNSGQCYSDRRSLDFLASATVNDPEILKLDDTEENKHEKKYDELVSKLKKAAIPIVIGGLILGTVAVSGCTQPEIEYYYVNGIVRDEQFHNPNNTTRADDWYSIHVVDAKNMTDKHVEFWQPIWEEYWNENITDVDDRINPGDYIKLLAKPKKSNGNTIWLAKEILEHKPRE